MKVKKVKTKVEETKKTKVAKLEGMIKNLEVQKQEILAEVEDWRQNEYAVLSANHIRFMDEYMKRFSEDYINELVLCWNGVIRHYDVILNVDELEDNESITIVDSSKSFSIFECFLEKIDKKMYEELVSKLQIFKTEIIDVSTNPESHKINDYLFFRNRDKF